MFHKIIYNNSDKDPYLSANITCTCYSDEFIEEQRKKGIHYVNSSVNNFFTALLSLLADLEFSETKDIHITIGQLETSSDKNDYKKVIETYKKYLEKIHTKSLVEFEININIDTDMGMEINNQLYDKLIGVIELFYSLTKDYISYNVFLHNQKHTLGYIKNFMIRESTGKYLLFLEDDDCYYNLKKITSYLVRRREPTILIPSYVVGYNLVPKVITKYDSGIVFQTSFFKESGLKYMEEDYYYISLVFRAELYYYIGYCYKNHNNFSVQLSDKTLYFKLHHTKRGTPISQNNYIWIQEMSEETIEAFKKMIEEKHYNENLISKTIDYMLDNSTKNVVRDVFLTDLRLYVLTTAFTEFRYTSTVYKVMMEKIKKINKFEAESVFFNNINSISRCMDSFSSLALEDQNLFLKTYSKYLSFHEVYNYATKIYVLMKKYGELHQIDEIYDKLRKLKIIRDPTKDQHYIYDLFNIISKTNSSPKLYRTSRGFREFLEKEPKICLMVYRFKIWVYMTTYNANNKLKDKIDNDKMPYSNDLAKDKTTIVNLNKYITQLKHKLSLFEIIYYLADNKLVFGGFPKELECLSDYRVTSYSESYGQIRNLFKKQSGLYDPTFINYFENVLDCDNKFILLDYSYKGFIDPFSYYLFSIE